MKVFSLILLILLSFSCIGLHDDNTASIPRGYDHMRMLIDCRYRHAYIEIPAEHSHRPVSSAVDVVADINCQ